jgi:Stage II sporulation protein E (SpoIIE)
LLMEQDELPEVQATRTSPARKYMIGHLAKSLGKVESCRK